MRTALLAVALLLEACGGRDSKPVESLSGGKDTSTFVLSSLAGTRDGDKLQARAVFSGAGSESIAMDLRFGIGVPTHLESGTWTEGGMTGTVRERSVTFLGGQSGPPSLGGKFDLLGSDGTARYRVTIPVQELKNKL